MSEYSPNSYADDPRKVRLTKEGQDIARASVLSNIEYARVLCGGILNNMSNDLIKPDKDRVTGRFLPGNKIGAKGGRVLGSRNRLANEYVMALQRAFKRHGADCIERVAKNDPAKFLTILSAIMPKEVLSKIEVSADIDIAIKQSAVLDAYRALGANINDDVEEAEIIDG